LHNLKWETLIDWSKNHYYGVLYKTTVATFLHTCVYSIILHIHTTVVTYDLST